MHWNCEDEQLKSNRNAQELVTVSTIKTEQEKNKLVSVTGALSVSVWSAVDLSGAVGIGICPLMLLVNRVDELCKISSRDGVCGN